MKIMPILLKYKEIWFSDHLYDVRGYDCVIFRNCDKMMEWPGFRRSESTTIIMDLSKSEQELWKDMSETNCRKPINRAKKMKVTIKVNQHYEEFSEINRAFRKEKGLARWDPSIDFMKKYGTLFVTEYNGEILSGLFCLSDERTMMQLITSSKRLESSNEKKKEIANANKLMIWESIIYAKRTGMKIYDWGGYYTGEVRDIQKERINVFKRSFGGEIVTRYNYHKDYSLPMKLVKAMESIIKIKV
ncbi:hypothetical protein MCP_2542 [Methanocella paludicola SANAE]|uniref:BioF2-like acetyltransferase domain-containing protein n=1 Tax=Methanocella paludicola (strain DSM 17711 / JCM 13418 / NBRC 101707 / SANAE) TaxID=304371 RepID=D1Z1P2_METPS|nr:hypothetical protein MCP_2542 [Methanocella paludicola SANAE]